MTEQERFEAWNKSCEWFREYHGNSTEEDILNFDEENKCYHYSTQQKCWEAWQAAQQKEGYVLVPVETLSKIAASAVKIECLVVRNEFSDSFLSSQLIEQSEEIVELVKAAQEAE